MENNLAKKIALGTVQFGLNYGINNTRGQVPENEVFDILDYSFNNGIDTLDSAVAYGNSEEVIGKYLKASGHDFKLISKLPEGITDQGALGEMLNASLRKLNQPKLYGYLFHDFNTYLKNHELLQALHILKDEGKVLKIGFSLYKPEELDYLLEKEVAFDLVQFPYSVFDQRFESYLSKLKDLGIEVHVRSVFLQGLVFKNPDLLEDQFAKIKGKLGKLGQISADLSVDIASVCLNFALLNEHIDKVVIGVDSLNNLKNNIASTEEAHLVKSQMFELKKLSENDEKIILPFNWSKK